MSHPLGRAISRQLKEIIELHFISEAPKSEVRKEKEKQLKTLLDFFTKGLNLLVYFMLVIIAMRIVVIMVLNPGQGIYEIKKIGKENELRKISTQADTIRMKSDSINKMIVAMKQKEDSMLQLKKEINTLKSRTANDLTYDQSTVKVIPGTLLRDSNGNFVTSHGKKFVTIKSTPAETGVVANTNYGENYSIWKEELPNTMQVVLMLAVLFVLLWIMKWMMKFFYTIANLISPFSILKIIGLYTLIAWIFTTGFHLFETGSLFEVIHKIVP